MFLLHFYLFDISPSDSWVIDEDCFIRNKKKNKILFLCFFLFFVFFWPGFRIKHFSEKKQLILDTFSSHFMYQKANVMA